MKVSPEEIKKFQQTILTWYKKNKRDLPWRDVPLTTDSRSGASLSDPYKILVSEVMSQQTQLSRVIPKYEAWMQAFPDVQSLAKASTRDVLAHWSGLGYNRRALYLKKCAEELVKRATWPQTEKELRELPGIGEYTARALLCFAFNQQVAVVDTNVKKVILTHFGNVIQNEVKDLKDSSVKPQNDSNNFTNKIIQQIAEELLPQGKAYDWNQALMDYSALVISKDSRVQTLLRHGFGRAGQSKFKDSDRYYRGQIVRYLLTQEKINKKQLYTVFFHIPTMLPERLDKILLGMQKDNLIRLDKKHIMLAS